MKLTVFALVAGLVCLVAVTVNGGVVEPKNIDIEYIPQEFADEIAVDTYGLNIFSSTYWALKKVLRTLKGVNCTIQAVIIIKNAAEQFPLDIQACGVEVSKQLQSVLDSVSAVLSTCNDIITMNDTVCDNADTDANANLATKVSNSCFVGLLKKTMSLKGQIQKTISLIKKVPTTGSSASACVNTALSDLSATFTQFPSFVVNCSKLVSN